MRRIIERVYAGRFHNRHKYLVQFMFFRSQYEWVFNSARVTAHAYLPAELLLFLSASVELDTIGLNITLEYSGMTWLLVLTKKCYAYYID